MLRFRRVANVRKDVRSLPIRRISSPSRRIKAPSPLPPFPIIPTCPLPTCTCAETPPALQIEQKRGLEGSMAPYSQHVVISTGKSDWTSRIEHDGHGTPWGEFGRQLKAMLGRGGKYSDPYNNIMITNSSFSKPEMSGGGPQAFLFPSFKSISLPDTSHSTVEQFVQEFLLPETLHPMHNALSALQMKTLTRVAARSFHPKDSSGSILDLRNPTILICSHNSRDTRCGIMGPILQSEFVRQLANLGFDVSPSTIVPKDKLMPAAAQVGLISHIGGHKWAGNVIIYMPPIWAAKEEYGKLTTLEEEQHQRTPLAGCGVWYGRVEPKHVEGIIKETLLGGGVIKELFRGGIGPKSEVLRLPLGS